MILDLDILSAAHCVNGRTIEDVVVIVGSDNAEAELRMFNWKTLLKIDLFKNFKAQNNLQAIL